MMSWMTGRTFAEWMQIHGALMFISWGLLAPIGLYIARYKRAGFIGSGGWFPWHRAFMLAVLMLSAVGSTLAVMACKTHFDKPHKIVGPIANAMLVTVALVGMFISAYRGQYPKVNKGHIFFGYVTMLIGWANIGLGINDHPTWSQEVKIGVGVTYFGLVLLVILHAEWAKRSKKTAATKKK